MNAEHADKRIAILVDDLFEQVELTKPMETLKGLGARVDILAAHKTNLQAMRHADKGDTFLADDLIANAKPDDYDAVVIPGGTFNGDTLRTSQAARDFTAAAYQAGKPVAAICHGPWLLVSAGLAAERSMTSYHTLQDDIRNAGGKWLDQPVVVDGNLITSRQPDDLPSFCDAIVAQLGSAAAA